MMLIDTATKYYLEVIGEQAIALGSKPDYLLHPKTQATGITQSDYNRLKTEIDYYVNKGSLACYSDDSQGFQIAQKLKTEIENIEASESRDKFMPPASLKVNVAHKDILLKTAREDLSLEDDTPNKCMAKTKKGDQCPNYRVAGFVVCGVHKRNVENGVKVIDIRGNDITKGNYKVK